MELILDIVLFDVVVFRVVVGGKVGPGQGCGSYIHSQQHSILKGTRRPFQALL